MSTQFVLPIIINWTKQVIRQGAICPISMFFNKNTDTEGLTGQLETQNQNRIWGGVRKGQKILERQPVLQR